MDLSNSIFQLISSFCDFVKSVGEKIVSQYHSIEQKLGSLNELAVSNNNDIQLKLEELSSNVNLRLDSLEKKMQELHDLVSRSLDKSSQQLNKTCCHQELEQKEEMPQDKNSQEVMSTDSKVQELQGEKRMSFEQFNKTNCQQELEEMEKRPQEVMSKDAKTIANGSVELQKDMSNMSQLLDKFLFGSKEEQLAFESLCFKWTIKIFKRFIPKEVSHECTSPIFPVRGFHLKAQLRLTIELNGIIEFRLCFKDEERKGQNVIIKPLPMVTFIIKDLSGQNVNFIRYCFSPINRRVKYDEFGYWIGHVTMTRWNRLISACDKSMEVLVLVEPHTTIDKPLSVDGTMTDTIEHYSRKLQMEKEELINCHLSPAFLTHAGGFRVGVRMYLNGPIDKIKTGLKAWIYFLSGDFDSQLGREFEHETSVTLINRRDALKNITFEKRSKKAESYCILSASYDEIISGGFLLNDSLTYQVTIKPIQ